MNPAVVADKVRTLREARGFSMRGLSKRADISVSFLSSIETGKSSPTLATLLKILEALDTTAPEFFADDETGSLDSVVFASTEMTTLDDGDKLSKFLFPDTRDSRCIMTYEEYRPHTRNIEKETHSRDVCVYVLEGELTLEIPGSNQLIAKAGDAAYIRAGTPHVATNRNDAPLRMVVVEIKS